MTVSVITWGCEYWRWEIGQSRTKLPAAAFHAVTHCYCCFTRSLRDKRIEQEFTPWHVPGPALVLVLMILYTSLGPFMWGWGLPPASTHMKKGLGRPRPVTYFYSLLLWGSVSFLWQGWECCLLVSRRASGGRFSLRGAIPLYGSGTWWWWCWLRLRLIHVFGTCASRSPNFTGSFFVGYK